MSKSIKLKNDVFLNSESVIHNKEKLSNIIQNINSDIINIYSSGVGSTTEALSILISKDNIASGKYLVFGTIPLNYFGQNGRELNLILKLNDVEVWRISNVCNMYTWTMYAQLCTVINIKNTDSLTLILSTTDNKQYSCKAFTLNLFKLK